ncbi:MAG TPA: hypothetical protein VNC39_00320 [Acidocella sp.]|jgi:hypothetical protein|uniref:hypothetical protein n=1 Tax=Acidocella sp. TaxID=50710 RepID=UPI002CF57441|nr:hypothetical protein [Acidocella sp.]HVE20395.1 hypothetical protein [Acidocella sp.]
MTLSEALVAGRLPDFIAQEEARGIGPADHYQFDQLVKMVAAPPKTYIDGFIDGWLAITQEKPTDRQIAIASHHISPNATYQDGYEQGRAIAGGK